MGLVETRIESLPFVTAELNYLAPTTGKPRTYAFDPPPGELKSTNVAEPHQVPIFDGRQVAKSFSLDREGFELVKHPTAVRNFYDEAEIIRVVRVACELAPAGDTGSCRPDRGVGAQPRARAFARGSR